MSEDRTLPEYLVAEVHQAPETHLVAHCEGEDWVPTLDADPLSVQKQAHDHTMETGHVTRVMQTRISRTTFSRTRTKELYG